MQLNEIKAKIETVKDAFPGEVATQAREDYNQYYEDEIKLNKEFGQFVQNYKAAYEGRNSRKEQVIAGSSNKKQLTEAGTNYTIIQSDIVYEWIFFLEYSEFLDDLMMKPGPRYLPLGKFFQLHVAKFE